MIFSGQIQVENKVLVYHKNQKQYNLSLQSVMG